jgi:(S)-3,5-dihydroxyphenylglycine transaminase
VPASATSWPTNRFGTARGSHSLADDLTRIKSMITVNTPSLSQAVIGGLLRRTGGGLVDAVRPVAEHYGHNMALALEALERHFPPAVRDRLGVSWNRPDGGFFLSLRLPVPADTDLLRRSAEHYGVIWTPMRYFHVGAADPQCDNTIRLSISYLRPAQIDDGVAALARLIQDVVTEARGEHRDVD